MSTVAAGIVQCWIWQKECRTFILALWGTTGSFIDYCLDEGLDVSVQNPLIPTTSRKRNTKNTDIFDHEHNVSLAHTSLRPAHKLTFSNSKSRAAPLAAVTMGIVALFAQTLLRYCSLLILVAVHTCGSSCLFVCTAVGTNVSHSADNGPSASDCH